MSDDRDKDLKVIRHLEQFGGGFCHALAQLWYKADKTNQLRIKTAFADYFEQGQQAIDMIDRQKVAGK